MNIYEACKLAGEGGEIARRSDLTDDNFYLVTNRHSGISMFADGQRVSGMWNPVYRDLVAEDWVVIKKGPFKGPMPDVIEGNKDYLK